MKNNEINVVIGSWGSYNECNERALGSNWLCFNDYSDWDEVVEELFKEGFDLNGIDEELFIQDIEGIDSSSTNWDYMNPERLFNILKESGVLDHQYTYAVMNAFIEVRSFDDFEERVERDGEDWDQDIRLFEGYDWEDNGKEMFSIMEYNIPEHIIDFIDFEEYGRYMGQDTTEEYSGGIIDIY